MRPFKNSAQALSIFLATMIATDASAAMQNKVSALLSNDFGLQTTTFATPAGKVIVNLPEDMAPGDVVSGSILTQPAGSTAEEKTQNEDVLNSYVVELRRTVDPNESPQEDSKKSTSAKMKAPSSTASSPGFTCLIPATAQMIDVALIKDSKLVGTKSIKLGGAAAVVDIAAGNMMLPQIGQAGRPVQVRGVCDGNFGTSNVTMGGSSCRVLAESPRGMILQGARDTIGITDLSVFEGGKTARTKFRNILVKLSCPKTMLKKAERATVTVNVAGLDQFKEPLQLKLTNLTPATVDIEGGNDQILSMQSSQKTFAVKAREGGPFSVRAVLVPPPATATKAEEGSGTAISLSKLGQAMAAMRGAFKGFSMPTSASNVVSMQNDIANVMRLQQAEFLARLAASPGAQNLSESRRAALLALYMQYRRDQMIRNFERQLLTDKVYAAKLGVYGRRDLLWWIRDVLYSASNLAMAASIRSAGGTPPATAPATPGMGTTAGAFLPGSFAMPENMTCGVTSSADAKLEETVLASTCATPSPSADDVASRFRGLFREGDSDQAAKKVVTALGASTMMEETDSIEKEADMFVSFSDKLDIALAPAGTAGATAAGAATSAIDGEGKGLARPGTTGSATAAATTSTAASTTAGSTAALSAAATSVNPDDFDTIVDLADKLLDKNVIEKKQLLELAMEAAGRLGSNPKSSDEDRKRAREFALKLTVRFHSLKALLNAGDEPDTKLVKDIDFNIDKCLRITDGKDFYA